MESRELHRAKTQIVGACGFRKSSFQVRLALSPDGTLPTKRVTVPARLGGNSKLGGTQL